jgi:hypothetical protein
MAASCCFLVAQPPPPPLCVNDTVYRFTAAPNGQMTVTDLATNQVLGTATVEANGVVRPPTLRINTGQFCFGQPIAFRFNYAVRRLLGQESPASLFRPSA